jgi:hypothetical protein
MSTRREASTRDQAPPAIRGCIFCGFTGSCGHRRDHAAEQQAIQAMGAALAQQMERHHQHAPTSSGWNWVKDFLFRRRDDEA